jgi:predicted transcriptional regulator
MLTVNGLLEYQASEEIYRTTAKGRKFLELYSSMGELVVDAAELAQTRR